MSKAPIQTWLLALCLAMALAPAWAQRRMALVIGNSDYVHESRLSNPANDARLIARTLRGLGFTVEERLNLRQRDMTLAITRFTRESAGADTALLYFAGHGMQPSNGGRNYLLPVDANIDNDDALDSDGIAADRVVEQMERTANPAKLRLVVLDACRNNPRAGRTRGTVRGLSRMTPADDYTLIAFSTNDQDVAQDGSGAHSPYAEALNRHLARARELPLRRIFELTASDVRAATGQKQRPRTYGDLDSRVGLDGQVLASAAPDPLPQREPVAPGPTAAQLEQQAWEAAQRVNSLAAYDAYLAEYPGGRFSAAARVARASVLPSPAAGSRRTGEVVTDCATCPPMVFIPAGSFQMGSHDGDADEKPVHTVSVPAFLMGRTEVTQGQWKAVMGSNPSYFSACGDTCPVVRVSWHEAQEFVRRLSTQTGHRYRLPSEAEWEYAARAGSPGRWSFGDMESQLGEHAWFQANSGGQTRPVAGKRPNAWGLHDMHGNVWEWVQDVWHANYVGAPTDGSDWSTGGDPARRVLRGGSWSNYPLTVRSAIRYWVTPDFSVNNTGFRIARTL